MMRFDTVLLARAPFNWSGPLREPGIYYYSVQREGEAIGPKSEVTARQAMDLEEFIQLKIDGGTEKTPKAEHVVSALVGYFGYEYRTGGVLARLTAWLPHRTRTLDY